MNYHKKETLNNQYKLSAAQIANGCYWQNITLVLHNGVMNSNGFVSITMSEFNTQYSSDKAKTYNSLAELKNKIKEMNYNVDIAELTIKYNSLTLLRKELNIPEGFNRN